MNTMHRYPGSVPFTREDEEIFFGRGADISSLSTFITVQKSCVLYGKSGLGKSSLLNAGVLPKLESEYQYLTIPVRLGSFTEGTRQHPLDIVEEKLIEYSSQESFLKTIESEDMTLWQHMKNMQIAHNDVSCFLLVFDQFEELFTYPQGLDEFARTLGELLYNRMPKSFERTLHLKSRRDDDLLTDEQWEFLQRPLPLKVLMSIRSDQMSLLDRISTDIPSILHHCYELKPLSPSQAKLAITEPAIKEGNFASAPFRYEPEALGKIIDYLTGSGGKEIESFQLQILCNHVEENIVISRNKTDIEVGDIGNLEDIYHSYYDANIERIGTEEEQNLSRVLIEEGLIFEEEQRRVSLYQGQIENRFKVNESLLKKLVNTHLIRAEPHSSGGYMYEISHDTLVSPILRAKETRFQQQKEETEKKQFLEIKSRRMKKLKRASGSFIFVLIVGFMIYWVDSEITYKNPVIFYFNIFFNLNEIGSWQGKKIRPSLMMALGISIFFFFFIVSLYAFLYEFITEESLLSELRERVNDPEKQKGILTRIGRWLS